MDNENLSKTISSGPTQIEDLNPNISCPAEFPRQIQNHHFHPSHPLFLVYGFRRNGCNSCQKGCNGFFFRCELCDFDLDPDCIQLTPTIKYLGHVDHLLLLFDNYPLLDTTPQLCNVCQTECNGLVLSCVPCDFNLHVNCLPHTVRHKSHRHLLTLTTFITEEDKGLKELYCRDCMEKINSDEPIYYCAKCYYAFHIGCVPEAIVENHVVPTTLGATNLVRVDKAIVKLRMDIEVNTTNLEKQKRNLIVLEGRMVDFERKISQKYQERYTKFPLTIQHPFHSIHPLTFVQVDFPFYHCSVCKRRHRGFRYHCSKCDFFLDINCVLRKPTIKYDGHQQHLLIFLKKLYGDDNICDACNKDCKASPILRCANCDLNLHIDCFPSLPPTFKNPQCHLHTLTLIDSYIDDPSADKFYCDFCKDERDPKLPVYYCEECSFVAHVTCVLHEELPSIIAELDSTKRDGVVKESVFVVVSNNFDEVADQDPTLAKLDEEIVELEAKLLELKGKRSQYLADTTVPEEV